MNAKSAKPHEAHFLVIEDDKGKKVFLLQNSHYSLGRARDCDVRIRSHFVSRRHGDFAQVLEKRQSLTTKLLTVTIREMLVPMDCLLTVRKFQPTISSNGDQIVFGPQACANYQYRQYDNFPTLPSEDPFDITLIDPAMMSDDAEVEDDTEAKH